LGRAVDTIDIMPVQMVAVKGDVAKFRAINWMNDGYTGGIKDMTVERKLGKDVHVSFEGHATTDSDLGAKLTITKGEVGYFKLDYGTFRKWFDNIGGNYPVYNTLKINALPQTDLHLDIGHFLLETGLGPIDDPKLSFSWERDTKNGDKDRLSWASVFDTVAGVQTQKKTAPSSEHMDQTTDTLTLKGKTEIKGFTVKAQGNYEFYEAENSRNYQALATYTVATNQSDVKQLNQLQSKVLASTLMADRWSVNDDTYVAFGYHFARNRSTEIINVNTYNSSYAPIGTVNNVGFAVNTQDTNTWIAQFMHNITPALNFNTKFKAEMITRRGIGEYDIDSTNPPDGIANRIDGNTTENKIYRTGESAGLRYNGIPRTSLYSEVEFQQERNWVSEARDEVGFQGTSATSVSREQIARNPTLIQTVGARFAPTKTVNLTTQFKHSFGGQTFDTVWKSDPVSLNRDSFFNKMNIDKTEVASKISWKPFKWLENSFKNKMIEYVYHTNAVTEDWEKAGMSERDYIYDITLTPNDSWMFNLSYNLQNLKSSTRQSQTPDVASTSIGVPVFTANVYTWMFTTSYAPRENLSVFNSVEFSRAKNPNNNYTNTGTLRYGVDDQWWNTTIGVRWNPRKDLTIEPHYAYYSFRTGQSVESGNYSAQVIWLETKLTW